MEYGLGVVTGVVIAIAAGALLIASEYDECRKKFNVYECEKHVEWRPIQTLK